MARTLSLALGVCATCVALCAPSLASAGPFDEVAHLDAKLVRGQSTPEDVRRLLGKPDGKGGARLPPDWTQQELWFYQEIVVHSSMWNPEIVDGKMEADAEMRNLYVLFREGRFDGYFWFGVRVEGEEPP